MAKTITSANATLTLTAPEVFPVPINVQGFATDDAFSTEAIDVAETMMGVDGKKSAGFIPFITSMTISLQADSDSRPLFETLLAAEKTARETFRIDGVIQMPSIQTSFVLTNGTLKRVTQFPGAKKTLQAVQYTIDWESIDAVPLA